MSAAIDAGAMQRPQHPSLSRAKVTFARVVRSEWRKLTSLRSTWILLGIGVVLSLGIPLIGALGVSSFASGSGAAEGGSLGGAWTAMANELATAGLPFGALLVAVAFTVSMAGEYNTHTIVSTLSAVPSRTPVYLAKALLGAVVAFLAGALLHLAALGLASLPIRARGFEVGVPDDLLRAVAVSGLHVAVVTMLGLALGALIRNTAGAIVLLVALVLVVSSVLGGLAMMMPTAELLAWFSTHLPVESVEALRTSSAMNAEAAAAAGVTLHTIETWDAALSSAVWILAPLIAGWLSFKLRPVK